MKPWKLRLSGLKALVSPESRAEQQEKLFRGLSEAQKRQNSLLQKMAGGPSLELKEVPELVAPSPERIEAARELGIDLETVPAAVLSTNDPFIEVMQGLRSMPGSKMGEEDKAFKRNLAQKAVQIIDDFGGTTQLSDLSDRFKQEITDTINEMYESSEASYKEIAELIPATANVFPDSLKEALDETAANRGGVEYLDGAEKRLFNIMQKNPDGVNYALIDNERKKIGSAISKSKGVYKDDETGNLKRLYSLLTEAQELTADEYGAADLWSQAKKEVAARKTLEDNTQFLLGKNVTGALMPRVGQAVRKLEKGDYKAFDETMAAIPKDYREEVVLSALNDAMTGGKAGGEQQLNASKFVNWYKGLSANPSAKQRIEQYLPEGASTRLKHLFELAEGVKTADKEFIGTGKMVTLLDNFGKEGGLASKLYGTGKQIAAAEGAASTLGAPGAGTVGVIASTLATGKEKRSAAADAMLTDPAFKNSIAAYADTSAKAKTKQAAADRALERSEKYKRWLRQLPAAERVKIARIGLISYLSGESTETPE